MLIMLKHYVSAGFRKLVKNRLTSMINIFSLTVSIASNILILLFILNETSYDIHWNDHERIYRIFTLIDRTGDAPQIRATNTLLLMPALRQYFQSDIEAATQTFETSAGIYVNNEYYEQPIMRAEAEFADIFNFDELYGDLRSTLTDPSRIALRQDISQKYFGRDDSTGETITLMRGSDRIDYTVGSVFQLPKGNSMIYPEMLMPMEDALVARPTWTELALTVDYIKLREGLSLDEFTGRLPSFIDTQVDISLLNAGPNVRASQRMNFLLQNVSEVYLEGLAPAVRGGSLITVAAFIVIAFAVLLIACINFTILSISQGSLEIKEIGLHKALGAERRQIFTQYLSNSFLYVTISMIGALAIAKLFLPIANDVTGKNISITLTQPLLASLVVMYFLVGTLGGFYQALVLSNFRPQKIFRAKSIFEKNSILAMRNILVILQFTIGISLLIATLVFNSQLDRIINGELGFNRENVLIVDGMRARANVRPNRTLFKERVDSLPNVTGSTYSSSQPLETNLFADRRVEFSVEGGDASAVLPLLAVDADFFRTFQIQITDGRNFDKGRDRSSDYFIPMGASGLENISSAIVNESAVSSLGFGSQEGAIGAVVSAPGFMDDTVRHYFQIIGVARDTRFFSMRSEPRAEIYIVDTNVSDALNIKYQGDRLMVLSDVSKVWDEVMGDAIFSASFVDQNIQDEFTRERREMHVLGIFSILTIVIACSGLFGSAKFFAQRKTKEIGIRKVYGASVSEIYRLIILQYTKPVLVGNFMAWLLSFWVMGSWLEQFPDQISNLSFFMICGLATLLSFLVASSALSYDSLITAKGNPSRALRSE